MRKYELLYAIAQDVSEEQREALIEKWKKFIEDRQGNVLNIDKWGMKKLAYPVKFKNEGFFVLMNFESEPSVVREMENAMNITEAIIRKMFTARD